MKLRIPDRALVFALAVAMPTAAVTAAYGLPLGPRHQQGHRQGGGGKQDAESVEIARLRMAGQRRIG